MRIDLFKEERVGPFGIQWQETIWDPTEEELKTWLNKRSGCAYLIAPFPNKAGNGPSHASAWWYEQVTDKHRENYQNYLTAIYSAGLHPYLNIKKDSSK